MSKAKAPRKPREKKPKQGFLPDMEPPSIREIDEAAEDYYDLNDESWKLRGKVKEVQDVLLELMKKHDITTYEFDDKTVVVLDKETVKVKKKREAEDAA